MYLTADVCVDLTVFFVNTINGDSCQNKVIRFVFWNANVPDLEKDWHYAHFLKEELFWKPVSIDKSDSAPWVYVCWAIGVYER